VVGYGYNFGCTSDAEFLLEWGCALVAGPAPTQVKSERETKERKEKNWGEKTNSIFLLFFLIRLVGSRSFQQHSADVCNTEVTCAGVR
jgi:hypothetical protein